MYNSNPDKTKAKGKHVCLNDKFSHKGEKYLNNKSEESRFHRSHCLEI